MLDYVTEGGSELNSTPIIVLNKTSFKDWVANQTTQVLAWVDANGFQADPATVLALPGAKGGIDSVLFGLDANDPWAWAHLPAKLPRGHYRIHTALDRQDANWAALAWELACYQFTRYKSRTGKEWPTLAWPETTDRQHVARQCDAIRLVRDLVNTPAGDMGPEDLAITAARLAQQAGGRVRSIVGDGLLHENYPLIHAVGRASTHVPRLIDLRWGEETAPKLTIIGKGVCFDSGGLDLKSSATMKIMKKDMGGAAYALGLASMIMAAQLPVRLRILIPAVENAVSSNAYHPLDILPSRKGLTVEVGNTDAEGRLVLADCLTEADRENPDLLIDLATLTGAARTALGPDLPALFSNDDALAADLLASGESQADPLWRLPLWKGYRRMLDSKLADLCSAPDNGHAGAITAALFLQEFVSPNTAWAHLDVFAWNPSARPGRPEGGDAMGLRAIFHAISQRYPS